MPCMKKSFLELNRINSNRQNSIPYLLFLSSFSFPRFSCLGRSSILNAETLQLDKSATLQFDVPTYAAHPSFQVPTPHSQRIPKVALLRTDRCIEYLNLCILFCPATTAFPHERINCDLMPRPRCLYRCAPRLAASLQRYHKQ